MLKRIKTAFARFRAWLKSFWAKEEPKLAAAAANLPADVSRFSAWLSALDTSIGSAMKAALGMVLDITKWWTLIKYGAIAASLIAAMAGSWLSGHSPVPKLRDQLGEAQAKLSSAAKQIAGLTTSLNSADKTIASQKETIATLMTTAKPAAKPKLSGNTRQTSGKSRPAASASSPGVNWLNAIVGN